LRLACDDDIHIHDDRPRLFAKIASGTGRVRELLITSPAMRGSACGLGYAGLIGFCVAV
jgi:hypothetical protein